MIPEPTRPQLDVAARTSALLATPVRMHLVALVAEGGYDVGTLSDPGGGEHRHRQPAPDPPMPDR